MSRTERAEGSREQTPWGEWVAGLCGVVCVLVTVGVMAWEGWTATGDRPALSVRIEQIVEVEGQWYVEVEVSNRGDVAAAEVVIAADLGGGATREATLDFVPSGSSREATLVVGSAPSPDALVVRVVSFLDP